MIVWFDVIVCCKLFDCIGCEYDDIEWFVVVYVLCSVDVVDWCDCDVCVGVVFVSGGKLCEYWLCCYWWDVCDG